MKLVKENLYNNFINFKEDSDPIEDMKIGAKEAVEKWLDSLDIKKYKLTKKLTINVYDNVILENKNLIEFPDYIKFNHITGGFHLKYNNLSSLRGCPYSVTGSFIVSYNDLKNLEKSPFIVNDIYAASNNDLESLDGITEYIGSSIYLHNNNLKTLKGIQSLIKGDLNIKDNPIETLDFFPDEIEGNIYFTPSKILTADNISKRCKIWGHMLV